MRPDLLPDIGFYHPIVIHFAIGLLAAGVLLRGLSLVRRGAFARPVAVALIVVATAAIVVAAQSGEDAHVAVEAAPGIAAAVRAHQQWGERTRNVALVAAGLELVTLASNDPRDVARCGGCRRPRVPLHPRDR